MLVYAVQFPYASAAAGNNSLQQLWASYNLLYNHHANLISLPFTRQKAGKVALMA